MYGSGFRVVTLMVSFGYPIFSGRYHSRDQIFVNLPYPDVRGFGLCVRFLGNTGEI